MNVVLTRRTWLTAATVAATFAFLVLAVMLALHIHALGDNPFDDDAWRIAKAEVEAHPDDPAAEDRLRALDLDLRRAFFRRRTRLRTGGVLLLVGLVVALVALKRANRRSLPEPDEPAAPDSASLRDRERWHAHLAVVTTGVLLGGGALYLHLALPSELALPAEGVGLEQTSPPAPTLTELAREWPSFRGHDGSGVAPTPDAPQTWDGTAGSNIVWRTPIPLPGANSPILWGDRVYLTGANAEREEVYCLDALTGTMLWRRPLVAVGSRGEADEPMDDTGHAAPTAVTDGRYVCALFTSGRVAAFDQDGEQLWLRSFGPFDNAYGHSSSLALFEDRLLLQLDHGLADHPVSRLVALDVATGETVWETARKVDASWASPIVCHPPSGPQVILSATPIVAAYDPRDGTEIWRADVLYGEVAPTPIYRDGVVYVQQEDVGLYAIRTDGTGNVTETHVAWNLPQGAPDVASPLCDGERVYMLTTTGTLTCVRAASGELIWEHELESDYYASPSLAGDLVYVTSWNGVTTTINTGDEYAERGTNPLGEDVYASLTFGPGRIYLRGEKHLFAIGEAK